MIKHSIIADPEMFAYLEKNMTKVLRRDRNALEYLIPRNAAIKAHVVTKDERESGLREILNFGHTFGHALESTTKYRRYQHGEAVAWGMMAAALLAHEISLCSADYVARIVALIRRIGPLPPWPRVRTKSLIDAMRSDKKARYGKLRFVLSPRLGKAASYDDIPLDVVHHSSCISRRRYVHHIALEMNRTPMPEAVAASPKGTRPDGAHSEHDASRQVREMFTQIAPRYDLLNHLLSMQLDRLWRARVARRLRPILEAARRVGPRSLLWHGRPGVLAPSFRARANHRRRVFSRDADCDVRAQRASRSRADQTQSPPLQCRSSKPTLCACPLPTPPSI